MKLHFLGAIRTTTGSKYILEVNGNRILLECGMFQGRRMESIEKNSKFDFDPAKIDCVVLSHAHIDHCGVLPSLCLKGFTGNIYSTFATRDLCSIILEDSAKIQKADAAFVSKERAKEGLPPVEPLYGPADAERSMRQFVTLNYYRPIPIAPGVTLTFYDAGHILGSSQICLDIEENGKKFRYLFTGDLGRSNDEILRDPDPVENVDYLHIESTYGARLHETKTKSTEEVLKYVGEALHNRATVLIPAFSMGRTQDIVYTLHQLTLDGKLPEVPIFVDSPLSVNATEVYRLHPECFNNEIYEFLQSGTNPFGMGNLTYIREVAQSMKLNNINEPAIIISASGMCEAGRIRHHLKNHIADKNTLILFIGYCAQNTLGNAILSGDKTVNIFGKPFKVKAKVAQIDSFSGHADRDELLKYIGKLKGSLKKIFVTHGEENQSIAFGETLRTQLPESQIVVPYQGDCEEIK